MTDHPRPHPGLVRRVQEKVAEGLGRAAAEGLDEEGRRAYGTSLIRHALAGEARRTTRTGLPLLSAEEEDQVAAEVAAHLWGLGRLQRLIDDPPIENINVNGADVVWVSHANGTKDRALPVADSDEELVELIRRAAAHLGQHERRFDLGSPQLDLRLPDGSRLSAVMAVCERPSVSVRRHRHPDRSLEDLVAMAMLSDELAALLAGLVAARQNIAISGETNAGKTTLLRALAAEIPPEERVITIETAFELGLDKQVDRHPDCVALEARPPNLEGAGEVTLASLVNRTRRMTPDRVILGEVLGAEVVTMLNVMSQGNRGSFVTVHADSSEAVFGRLATYAIQAPEHLAPAATAMAVAQALDFIIHIELAATRAPGGGRRVARYVSSVREVVGADGDLVHSNEVWRPGPDGRARPGVPLSTHRLRVLDRIGYEPPIVPVGGARWS
ncbi:MAG TPA: ATPase, T2SS/T4P/T4SS family [Acidimicrobiales bacterium]|nr:ATPase, T2SS/T4P/T4SS family [Acidimicrobiales bacterium]